MLGFVRGDSREESWFAMGDERKWDDCSAANSWATYICSTIGCLVAVPVGIKRKSLGPLLFFGTTGIMMDILLAVELCGREYEERQQMLMEQGKPGNNSTEDADKWEN